MPLGGGWAGNCETRASYGREMSAMAGRTTVSVGAGMRVIVKNFSGGVLDQYKACEDGENEDGPPL